jgi:hypothetical protein
MPVGQPPSLNLSESAVNNFSVAGAFSQKIQAAQQALLTQHNIINAIAMAIDHCLEGYIRPAEILVAQELQQRVLQALAASVETSTYTPLTSSSKSGSQRSYAELVQTPKNAFRLRV